LKSLCAILLSTLFAVTASSQVNLSSDAPKKGAVAPALNFDHLLGAPAGTKTDLPSLHGKVVVLEFWATWCAPCVAEIPILNSLVASADPNKVQFISVDDEAPTIVEPFLKKKPISGWIGLDTSSAIMDRYGVIARPATIIIGPDGRIISNTTPITQLTSDQLLKLARNEKVTFNTGPDPKGDAVYKTIEAQEMGNKGNSTSDVEPLYSITLTPGDPIVEGKDFGTHTMMLGPGKINITNGTLSTLLSSGESLSETRIVLSKDLPKVAYNLQINTPGADIKQQSQAVELAISTGAHVRIEHVTALQDAYVLTAKPGVQEKFQQVDSNGIALYSKKEHALRCIYATADQIATALEKALGKPVVNESALTGKLMQNFKFIPNDLDAANAAFAELGLVLAPAQRQIETVNVTPLSQAAAPQPQTATPTALVKP
jgi:thiol-disulfide isomerase/thioredoxin